MNTWYERFKQHRLQSEIQEIETILSSATPKVEDPALIDAYERLAYVLRMYIAFIRAIDPNRTTPQYLDSLLNTLPDIKNNLAAFVKTGNAANLNTANTQADQLLPRFQNVISAADASVLTQSAQDYARQADALITTLAEKTAKAQEQVTGMVAHVTASAARLTQLDSTIEAQKKRLDEAIAQFQKQFSESDTARRMQAEDTERNFASQFQQFRESISKDVQTLLDSQKKELASTVQNFSHDAAQIIKHMEDKKVAAARLLDVSANVAITGNYDKCARSERFRAEALRIVALLFMAALVFGAIETIKLATKAPDIDWKLLAIRFATTLTLAIPAFYAVRESNKHRVQEIRYRRMQLELAAIDPYLELLEKPKRDEIKAELTEKFFAQPELKDETNSVDSGTLFDLIRTVLVNLTKK